MIYKNNLNMDSAEKKDDELVTMQNPDMKDQFSPNIQPSKKMIILLVVLGIAFIAIVVMVIVFALNRNDDEENKENKEKDKKEEEPIIPVQISFNATYRTDADNQTIELIKYFGISDILETQINGAKVEPCKNYTFPKSGNQEVSFLLNTTNYKELTKMFYGLTKLVSISFTSNFDTKNVVNMAQMFSGCTSLTSIDLSSFDTKNVEKNEWNV